MYTVVGENKNAKQEFKQVKVSQWKMNSRKYKVGVSKFKSAARNDGRNKTDCNRFSMLVNEECTPSQSTGKELIGDNSLSPVFERKKNKYNIF